MQANQQESTHMQKLLYLCLSFCPGAVTKHSDERHLRKNEVYMGHGSRWEVKAESGEQLVISHQQLENGAGGSKLQLSMLPPSYRL